MNTVQGKRFSRVLIVEGQGPRRRLLGEILQGEGYHLAMVDTVASALTALAADEFDAVVVSRHLSDGAGLDLLDQIQARHDPLAVILRIGPGLPDEVKQASQRGAFSCIVNLDDPSETLREVHLACRQRFDRYAMDLEAAVRQRTEELARSNRELADFAAVVAHDLRSPLLTISGYCHVLREEYRERLDSTADGYIDIITNGIARMNRLIEDLLDYSRVDSSQSTLGPIDLGPVLVQVQANLEGLATTNDARINVGPLPTVWGDTTQLVQLFQNLLGNAIQFRQDHPPEIQVSSTPRNDHHVIRVTDNGVGIDPSQLDKVFQVFHRVPGGRRHGGTGIGLAICKKIVERHRGRIWVESEPGRGSTFLLTLPDGRKPPAP